MHTCLEKITLISIELMPTKHFKNFREILNVFLFFWISVFFLGCNSEEVKLVKETRFLMGTLFDVTVSHPNAKEAKIAIEKVFEEIQRIELLTSKFNLKSEVTKINQRAGDNAFAVGNEVYELIRKSIYYSQLTEGAFDITVGAIQDLWDFENEKNVIPSSESLSRLLPLVNFRNVLLGKDNHVNLIKSGIKLDLGGVAKGYAVDRGIEILRKKNIHNAILNGGGDLKCIGEKSPGSPWKIGVRHPRKQASVIASLEGKDIAIATSGDYQNYFITDSVRYHHLLDPVTGRPAQGLQSVTIISKDTILADAMATAVFIMGPEKGLKFIESQKQLEGFLINSDGEKIISSGLEGKIKFHENN